MSGESEKPNGLTEIDHQSESETPEGATNSPSSQLSTTTLFDVLANQRRRYALRSLKAYETPITLADLADDVAIREHERPITEIPAEEVKRVYTSLYHAHIPKLADEGILEYSQEQDMVALSEDVDQLESLLKAITE